MNIYYSLYRINYVNDGDFISFQLFINEHFVTSFINHRTLDTMFFLNYHYFKVGGYLPRTYKQVKVGI